MISSNFYSKTNFIGNKLNSTLQKIDGVIIEERNNNIYLTNLEKKVSGDELKKISEALQNYKKMLSEKYTEYNQLLSSNTSKITSISELIRNNKSLIDNVYDLVAHLQDNTATIDSRLVNK